MNIKYFLTLTLLLLRKMSIYCSLNELLYLKHESDKNLFTEPKLNFVFYHESSNLKSTRRPRLFLGEALKFASGATDCKVSTGDL